MPSGEFADTSCSSALETPLLRGVQLLSQMRAMDIPTILLSEILQGYHALMSYGLLARRRCGLLLALAALSLAGCASLPSSGPTASDIVKRRNTVGEPVNFKIVDLDATAVTELQEVELRRRATMPTLAALSADRRVDLIGPGDVLAISIYEVGVSLFAGGGSRITSGYDPSAHGAELPPITVNAKGEIDLPYLGRLAVAGLSTNEVETLIEMGLRGKSQDPKAVVSIRQNISNTIYVSGDVRKPGRLDLTLGRERLLDAVANAGGAANSSDDTLIRFSRAGNIIEQRLSTVRSGTPDDLVLIPGDRIELIKRPRTYTVFGAARVAQISFETGDLSLAEAVARVSGPNDAAADPSAIFLFRYQADNMPGGGAAPVVFRLNMLSPSSYFLAQRFAMQDKDVIYVANANSNRPAKLVGIINQLFAPFVTARQLAP